MLQLFNTLSKSIEQVTIDKGDKIRMYTCGPTVYNYAHIGNLRSFIMADMLYRTLCLEFGSDKIEWVMNITDIEDKIIKGTVAKYGNEAGIPELQKFTEFYLQQFLDDLLDANVSISNIRLIRVTEVIPQIQEFILDLLDKGYAYMADDGSTYFSIEKYQHHFGDYGELVGSKFLEGRQVGARVKVDEYGKDNLSDFALWKARDENDGNIFWDHATLGKGRPGWHIECSVINRVAFGDVSTDVHTGGVDLIFPHHTNEIAQSQPLYQPFTRYWFHSEHLLVDGKKMSKSADNFYTMKDIRAKGFTGSDLRYLFLQGHYKTQQNFTWDSLQGARNARIRLGQNNHQSNAFSEQQAKMRAILSNDLNTAVALAHVWENKSEISESLLTNLFGLTFEQTISEEVRILQKDRDKARAEKDYNRSDELRGRINELGYEVLDAADGSSKIAPR